MNKNALSIFNQLRPVSVGFDNMFDHFEKMFEDDFFNTPTVNYPPYNLVKESDTRFRLELAVAGFSKEDVEVTTEYNKLTVEAKQEESTTDEYLHRGLAARAFNRSWTLSDDVEVDDVTFTDGLLTVRLTKIVPEHQKRKVYEITGS